MENDNDRESLANAAHTPILDIFSSDVALTDYLNSRIRLHNDIILKKNLIPIIPIIITRNFENNPVNERIDTFVHDTLRSNLEDVLVRRETSGSLSEPQLAQIQARLYGSKARGLYAQVVETTQLQPRLTINGREVIFEGHKYTRIDFTPGGRTHFDAAKMTDSLANGIIGLTEFLAAVDKGQFEVASVLMGTTNLNMALIAQRLGFSIVDQCRTADGTIDKKLSEFTVVGNLADIRARIEKFRREGTFEKVQARYQKLQRNLQRTLSPSTA